MTNLSFRLPDHFVDAYANIQPKWGYTDAGGNSLGEITFLRTYSRLKEDGSKERWHEVCRRVIEGMYSIQKDHATLFHLPWNEAKALDSATEAYDRLFDLKWTPPGRGLWMMGTPLVNEQKNSAALQNCAFVSTRDMSPENPAEPFAFLMEASMLGVGVGFDTKGRHRLGIYEPDMTKPVHYDIPDSREGWVDSTAMLINSYLRPDEGRRVFNYAQIRPAGTPIKTFGGTAAGPAPLIKLHEAIRKLFDGRAGELITVTDIADLGNLIGVCVVSGNVRRSAELLMGSLRDQTFLDLKNPEVFPERNSYDPDAPGWGWMSNNSVEADVEDNLDQIVDGIVRNGEPGVIWLDLARQFGRLADEPDYRDHRLMGFNPCAEQGLESYEMCTLVETYLNRHITLSDYKRTLKFAYLYAKTVTLLPTHWERTNAIMLRNRRIGTSMSGIADFADQHGLIELREWMDEGYTTVKRYDEIYSEWLCVRESIKSTTVKPSGTVSILAGASPGAHWGPGGEYYERRIRFGKDDPMVALFRRAGYFVEPASESPESTVVVAFPIHKEGARADREVSVFEKANLAALAQEWWSDNSVSVTLSFDREREGGSIGRLLQMYAGKLKTVSFLPQGNDVYPQMPYTPRDKGFYQGEQKFLKQIDFEPLYSGKLDAVDAAGEAYCTTDVCEIKPLTNNAEEDD